MPKTLAMIHTSLLFVQPDNIISELFNELMPDVRRINIIDDALLSDVMKVGKITPDVQQRMTHYVKSAELTGADAVLMLCSSLGPALDEGRSQAKIPVIKIDDAMTEKAVCDADAVAGKIGVMATVATTLGPTVELIEEKAKKLNKPVTVKHHLVAGAFETMMAGNRAKHDEMILGAAGALAGDVDLIVLAQASMSRLAAQIQEQTGLPVLSSPRLAMEYTKKVLETGVKP